MKERVQTYSKGHILHHLFWCFNKFKHVLKVLILHHILQLCQIKFWNSTIFLQCFNKFIHILKGVYYIAPPFARVHNRNFKIAPSVLMLQQVQTSSKTFYKIWYCTIFCNIKGFSKNGNISKRTHWDNLGITITVNVLNVIIVVIISAVNYIKCCNFLKHPLIVWYNTFIFSQCFSKSKPVSTCYKIPNNVVSGS